MSEPAPISAEEMAAEAVDATIAKPLGTGGGGIMTPDIQYFAVSGTWAKPAGAVRVDIMIRGGDGHGAIPMLGTKIGAPGELLAASLDAGDLPETVEVTVGKGGRPGREDGYALIVTHLTDSADDGQPPLVRRPRARAAEAARDAAECIRLGRIDDARDLLAEASRDLDTAERRAAEAAR